MSVFDRFDAYTISARLLPFLVLVLPALLLLAAWLPIGKLELPSVAAALVPFAAAALVAHLGRDEGKRKQAALFSRWGGAPTTILLRHVSADLNKITRARYHARLAALLSHPLPSSAAEQQDPAAADAVYESCADLLREKTRDKEKFPLIHAANREYGFRRNLWGMKPAAVVIGGVSLAAAIAPAFTELLPVPPQPLLIVAVAAAQAALLVIWLARITPEWVRAAGFAYAQRLLAACDVL